MSELGPLPHPVEVARSFRNSNERITYAYTADQLRTERERCYALGVAAERKRWVLLLQELRGMSGLDADH